MSRKKLFLIILASVLAFFVFIGCIFLLVLSIIKNSGSYVTACQYLATNKIVQQEVGQVKAYGFIPAGSFHISNGVGDAKWSILVKGDKGQKAYFVRLDKNLEHGWRVEDSSVGKELPSKQNAAPGEATAQSGKDN